jgi:hypothetical protein
MRSSVSSPMSDGAHLRDPCECDEISCDLAEEECENPESLWERS